jgi:hypothetical protein
VRRRLEGSGHLAAVRFLMLAARLVVLWGVLQAMAGLSGTAHIAIGGLGLACGVTGAVTLLRIRRGAGERPADRG